MKYLILLSLLFSACIKPIPNKYIPKYKEGDCYDSRNKYFVCEKWEYNCIHFINLIMEVGINKYRIIFTDINSEELYIDGVSFLSDERIEFVDSNYNKIECPKILTDEYNKGRK